MVVPRSSFANYRNIVVPGDDNENCSDIICTGQVDPLCTVPEDFIFIEEKCAPQDLKLLSNAAGFLIAASGRLATVLGSQEIGTLLKAITIPLDEWAEDVEQLLVVFGSIDEGLKCPA